MISKHKLGLVFGAFLGTWPFAWGGLVLSGIAQSGLNWIFRIHFIGPPYIIFPFNLGVAVTLILVTSIIGYLSGWFLGAIWNWLREDTAALGSISAVRVQPPAIRH